MKFSAHSSRGKYCFYSSDEEDSEEDYRVTTVKKPQAMATPLVKVAAEGLAVDLEAREVKQIVGEFNDWYQKVARIRKEAEKKAETMTEFLEKKQQRQREQAYKQKIEQLRIITDSQKLEAETLAKQLGSNLAVSTTRTISTTLSLEQKLRKTLEKLEMEERASMDKINQAKEREAAEEAAKIKKEQEIAAAAAAKLAEQQHQEMLKKQQMAKQQLERSSNASVHSMPSAFAAAFTQKPAVNHTPITTATTQMMDQEELAEVDMKPSVGTKAVEKKKGPSKIKSNEPKSEFVSPSALQDVKAANNAIIDVNKNVKPFIQKVEKLKKACFQQKLLINPKIGQLTNSKRVIERVSNEIVQIIKDGEKNNAKIAQWLLNFTAKAIVKQAEVEVTVKPSTAFPLALLCVNISKQFDSFSNLLIGRLIKNCPYIVPQYINPKSFDKVEDFKKQMAYQKGDTMESEEKYQERMNGILALYAAIIYTSDTKTLYPISLGWKWMARILNLPPRDITPSLINTFLEMTGSRLLKVYKRQFIKIIMLLSRQYLPTCPKTSVAACTRLRSFIERVEAAGSIPIPEGSQLSP